MLLPIMGILMFFIPITGVVTGIILLCIKSLRHFASFSFLVPSFASYAALIGFWSTAIGMEKLGQSEQLAGALGLGGLIVGGIIGIKLGMSAAHALLRVCSKIGKNKA